VRSADARIAGFAPPRAYANETASVHARFHNAGNVPFAPRADLVVRPNRGGDVGAITRWVAASAGRVAPGADGSITAHLALPRVGSSYELTLRLFDGRRLLDSRTVSVTVQRRPALSARVHAWITDHALLLVGALGGLLLAALAAVGVLARRRR